VTAALRRLETRQELKADESSRDSMMLPQLTPHA
jgi:hypothetical protein